MKEHNCTPLPSIIVPPLAQLPVFVLGTVMLGRLSLDPTPFDAESFLTLSTLAHPDPTMTLPIILGVITMANVESSNWVMNAAERERARQIEEQTAKRLAENGQLQIQPRSLIRSGLRILSVGRIIIAAMTPGVSAYFTSLLTPER
jgi:inner membrane protein COX18